MSDSTSSSSSSSSTSSTSTPPSTSMVDSNSESTRRQDMFLVFVWVEARVCSPVQIVLNKVCLVPVEQWDTFDWNAFRGMRQPRDYAVCPDKHKWSDSQKRGWSFLCNASDLSKKKVLPRCAQDAQIISVFYVQKP
jgi:hypothetical protein